MQRQTLKFVSRTEAVQDHIAKTAANNFPVILHLPQCWITRASQGYVKAGLGGGPALGQDSEDWKREQTL